MFFFFDFLKDFQKTSQKVKKTLWFFDILDSKSQKKIAKNDKMSKKYNVFFVFLIEFKVKNRESTSQPGRQPASQATSQPEF